MSKDLIDKINDVSEKLEKDNKILYYIFCFFSTVFVGIPLFSMVLVHMLYSHIATKNAPREEIIYAWVPKYTNPGFVWLKPVKRITYCNSDMISYKQFRYERV